MAIYHPPKMITNNAAPVLSADLAYENHGKCGQTRVIHTQDGADPGEEIFDSIVEGSANAWKMVILQVGHKAGISRCDCIMEGAITEFKAENISTADCAKLAASYYGESVPVEIMADITYVSLDTHMPGTIAILYLDCSQS